jgi:hypothetical protein
MTVTFLVVVALLTTQGKNTQENQEKLSINESRPLLSDHFQ